MRLAVTRRSRVLRLDCSSFASQDSSDERAGVGRSRTVEWAAALGLFVLLATSGCGKAEEGPGNATDTDGTGGEAALPPEEDPTEILGRPVTFREGIDYMMSSSTGPSSSLLG